MFEPMWSNEFLNQRNFICCFEALEKIGTNIQSDCFFKMTINKMAQRSLKSLGEHKADSHCLLCSILSLGELYSIFTTLLNSVLALRLKQQQTSKQTIILYIHIICNLNFRHTFITYIYNRSHYKPTSSQFLNSIPRTIHESQVKVNFLQHIFTC